MEKFFLGKIEDLSRKEAIEIAVTKYHLKHSNIKIEAKSHYNKTVYLACSYFMESGRIIFPVILLLSKKKEEWWCKEIKEYDAKALKHIKASKAVLSPLTIPSGLYGEKKALAAHKWREESVSYLRDKYRSRSNSLDVGDVIEFTEEVVFSNGLSGKIFKKINGSGKFKRVKRKQGRLVEMKHMTFSIAHYRKLNFEHLEEEVV